MIGGPVCSQTASVVCLLGARCNILVHAALLIQGWKAEAIGNQSVEERDHQL